MRSWQIALALRIVSGLTVAQIAKAFLVAPAAMEQRITRAKRRIAEVGVEFETPGAIALANSVAEANLIRRELDSLAMA
jgi:RNA polymerase sigma-70 factor, ECF subfamily